MLPGIDLAFDDAVADSGPRQLHDHVGRGGGERPEVHRLLHGDLGVGIPARGLSLDRDTGVGHAMHTSENSSTGQLTIDPRNDTARSMPVSPLRWSVCVTDQITPITR